MKWIQTTAKPKLRLRKTPKTGATLDLLSPGTQLKVLGEETWVKVVTNQGVEGYVLADYTEATTPPDQDLVTTASQPQLYVPKTVRIQGKPIKIAKSFEAKLDGIGKILDELQGLTMWVTSSLREPGSPVQGAVVQPAKMSNHFVGHAIDMNLCINDKWFNSSRLENTLQKDADDRDDNEKLVLKFFDEITTQLSLRWGGKFSPCDPVHIDDGLNVNDPDEYKTRLKAFWPGSVLP